jgi:hypothetical protein
MGRQHRLNRKHRGAIRRYAILFAVMIGVAAIVGYSISLSESGTMASSGAQ